LTEQKKSYWSECGQIFFIDGYGYGLTPDLHTLSLGKQPDIEEYLSTGEFKVDLLPVQKQILMEERNGIREDSMVGTESARATWRRKKNPQPLTSRKRFSLRKTNR
jgi:hypothetical protein